MPQNAVATQTVRLSPEKACPIAPLGHVNFFFDGSHSGRCPGRPSRALRVVGANEVLGDKEGVVLGVNLDASDIDGVDASTFWM